MIIRVNRLMKGFVGFTFYPFIFIKRGKDTPVAINHERIHLRQQKRFLIVGFFVIYILHYLINLFKYMNSDKAYRNICFEREAYKNERNLNYLKK